MTRRLVPIVALLLAGAMIRAQATIEFDVASIKRNTTNTFASGPPPGPASGQVSIVNVPVQTLVLQAYPLQTVPVQVLGLPAWAQSERYDVMAKTRPGVSQEERVAMWKTLLTERMQLVAHYETRSRQAYKLVIARPDGRLGPQLKPSTLDCPAVDPTKPPPRPSRDLLNAMAPGTTITAASEESLMSQCRFSLTSGNTTYAGAIPIQALIPALSFGTGLDRPVVDQTGLQGLYSVKLSFHRLPTPPGPDDPPSVFTALQEQLGLKLEPVTIEGQILVIDHIERPTEN